jgi:CBS domain-containing protein
MRTVADILAKKALLFNVIDPDAKVIAALQLMNSVNLSYLIVMKDDVVQWQFFLKEITAGMLS